MSVSRVVTLLTPTVFAPAAAFVVGWLGQQTGVHLSPTDVTALEVAGFSGAVALAGKWLHGRQKHEADVRAVQARQDPEQLLSKGR